MVIDQDSSKDEVEEAKTLFTDTLQHYSEEYERGEQDVEFALGNQWEKRAEEERTKNNSHTLVENRCMPFIEQVVNTAREMRPSVKVAPVDDEGDAETAEIFKGLIRNIERQSKASIAYDVAVQNSVMSGYGWIRIGTDYSDPMSFTQELQIQHVPDWRSVMLDPSSEMIDGSDAEYGFAYRDIDKKLFKEEYPDKEPLNFEGTECKDDEHKVRIVEYFYKSYEDQEIFECFLRDSTTQVFTKDQKEQLGDFVVEVLQERKTRVPTVKWCELYGGGKLKETEWLGEYIPLVPVYGKLVWHEGMLKSYSLITHAKDPQRMLNAVKSTIMDSVQSQSKNQPIIGAAGAFQSDSNWNTANVQSFAYLQYDPVIVNDPVTEQPLLAPPPTQSPPLQVSPALFQIEMNANLGINSSLGMYEENRGDESNAISGVAIQSRQIRGDKATFHFIDNLACSIRHVGVILIDLIPKIYNKKHVLRIVGNDDKEKTIVADPKGQTSKADGIYNLHAGKYDVDVDVGPSYATQQQEFLDLSKTLLQSNPEYAMLAGDKIVEAVGGVHADVIADRIRAQNPSLQSDDPMALALQDAKKQLQAKDQELENALIALDDKKGKENQEIKIKQDEVNVKRIDSETKRIDVLAKVEKMKLEAEGNDKEAFADFADAMIEMDAEQQDVKNALPIIMQKLSELDQLLAPQQATTPSEGDPAI